MSLDLAGTIPAPTFTGALSNARNASLAATITGPTFTGALSNPREMTLAGTITGPTLISEILVQADMTLAGLIDGPALFGDMTVIPGTDTHNRPGGRTRSGIGVATWDPPVDETPPPPRLFDVALAFTTPVMDGARPVYTVSRAEKVAHRDRIVIGGRDITTYRGVPTPFPGYSLVEPLMYGTTTIPLPQIAAAFERPGVGALRWCRKGAPVLIQRIDTDDEVVTTDYRGIVVAHDVRQGVLVLQVAGEVEGRAALRDRQPPIFPQYHDIGWFVARGIRELGLPFSPQDGPDTGIRIRGFGGTDHLSYIQQLIATGWTTSGNKWTVMPNASGVYQMTRKDITTIHGTVYLDDARTVGDVTRDFAEEPNRLFATVITPEGKRARFGAYPGLMQGPAAPYPMDDGSSFGQGTTNIDTDTGDGITVMIARLRVTGYVDADDAPGGYDADVTRAIKELQRDAGLSVTGNMNQNTWEALWDLTVTGYSLAWSKILPAAEKPQVKRWRRSSSGAIIARNPSYDPTHLVVDRTVDMGSGYTRPQVKEWARAEIEAEDNWVGTIRFGTRGLVNGEHTPGDPITATDVMRARRIRPGMNLWAPLFDGGTLFHVSAVQVDTEGIVTASVDTRARDAMEVWEVIDRNRETRRNPTRAWVRNHRSSTETKDSIQPWDEVGGVLGSDLRLYQGWTVFPVVAGEEGTIRSLRMHLQPAAEYVVAVFGRRIYPGALRRLIGNPLTEAGTKRWSKESIRNSLDRRYVLLYAAGREDAPCGYYPKVKGASPDDDDEVNNTATLTGRWEDDAGFSYHTFDAPVLWVAVYTDRDTTQDAGRIMWNQLETGV